MTKLRHIFWLIGLALIVAARPSALSQANPRCTDAYAPGIVLVSFRNDVSAAERKADLNVTATIPGIDVAALRVPSGQECAALEMLRRDPRVAFAELDYAVHATSIITPNDPGWTSQWGPAKIGAPAAWSVVTGTPDVVVAVLDSGVQLDHEDLADNLWTNPGETPGNGIDDDSNSKIDDFWGWHFYHTQDGLPMEDNHVADDHGHGAHVAGITGAKIDNGVGVAGMAGGGRLMAVKVLDQDGDGRYSDLAQGIVYAVDNGAQIINLSLGGTPSSQTLQEAVNYAHAHGVLVVAATGNDGGAVLYPAACEHVLAVAATDQNDSRPSFSNHGPQVDVAAPGVSIYSTGWPGDSVSNCANGYCNKSGTSMAAPHVSGLAALVWSARPGLTVEQVTEIITTTATDVNNGAFPGWDEYLGWGRIEAGQTLSATVHAGNLHLTASRPQLAVGETAVVTATVPLTDGTASLFVFAASGGIVSPEMVALADRVVTTTLTAGQTDEMAVITGTTGTLSGTLFLRLLPGPVVSATLTPASWEVMVGHSVAMTLTAADEFGNPPLDGGPIYWETSRGTMAPLRSSLYEGVGRATFTASPVHGPAVITASLEAGFAAAVTIDVSPLHLYYLPVILREAAEP